MVEEVFRAEFTEAKLFDTVDAARLEPGLLAIFEPRIEQFSFANAKETGGIYCAVTIRYQIGIYAPNGEQVDMLTLTGYGSGPAPKIGNGQDELAMAALRGHARCGGEIPHAVPGAGRGEAVARLAGADAEGSAAAGQCRGGGGRGGPDHRSGADQRDACGGDSVPAGFGAVRLRLLRRLLRRRIR